MKENIFRCFGISEGEVSAVLSPIIQNPNGVLINIKESQGLLVDILLKADDNNFYFYDCTRLIFEKLGQFIYSESELSLEEIAFQLLKLNKLKIATAESITGGQIVCNLIKNNLGASAVVVEGLATYANEAKTSRLGVLESVLNAHTSVSVQTTHEMAKGLLNTSPANIVIATTGYASSTNPSEDGGLVFVAIGTKERIDVYKNKLYGTRKEVIETASNLALFYLIKKLRKNDFDFQKNEI